MKILNEYINSQPSSAGLVEELIGWGIRNGKVEI